MSAESFAFTGAALRRLAAHLHRVQFAALLALLVALTAAPAHAELRIVLDKSNPEPLPIAITNFLGTNPRENQIGQDVTKVISDDLQRSGLFRPLDPRSFVQTAEFAARAAALRRLARDRRPGAGQRLGAAPARRPAASRIPPVGRLRRAADGRSRLFHRAGQLAPRRPHHRRRDLQAHHRRGRLFRHPHRLCRRRPGRAHAASSASPSWTRTAPTTAT